MNACPVTGARARTAMGKQVALSPNTLPMNFDAFLMASGLTIALFVFAYSTQSFSLSVQLGVARNQLGNASRVTLISTIMLPEHDNGMFCRFRC